MELLVGLLVGYLTAVIERRMRAERQRKARELGVLNQLERPDAAERMQVARKNGAPK